MTARGLSESAYRSPVISGVSLDQRAFITRRQLDSFLLEAERAGVRIEEILKRLGPNATNADMSNREGALTLAQYFRIEGEIARQLDDLTAHLSERKLTFETGAYVTTQINRSTTLRDAVTNLASHFNMMHGEQYNVVRVTDRTVTLMIDDSEFPYTIKDDPGMVHFVGECVLIKVHCLLDSLSEGLAAKALRRVSVKRQSAESLPGQLRFWSVPVVFGQANYTLTFDHGLAHNALAKSDQIDLSSEGVFSRVIQYLETRSPSEQSLSISTRTKDLIRTGILKQDEIARRLSISVATLRRRLDEDKTNFRELIDEYRLEEATSLLKKGYSVTQVSETLKYSDIRAFNRAFKRWTGVTPATYAKTLVS